MAADALENLYDPRLSNALRAGQNVMATEVVRYSTSGGGGPHNFSQTPMSAVLYVEAADGTVEYSRAFRRVGEAALNASGHWQAPEFDDASWNEAIRYVPPASGFETANWEIRGRPEP